MARWRGLLVAVPLMLGGTAAAQNVVIEPAPGGDAASEVYLLEMDHGTERSRRFNVNTTTKIWSVTIPVNPAARRTVMIRYARPIHPQALKLDLMIGPQTPSARLVLARPEPRSECNDEDSDALSERMTRLTEAREAARNIVQIDHLLANTQYPCPSDVPGRLRQIRGESLRFLRQKIPAIQDLQRSG